MSYRIKQINELVQHELGQLVIETVDFPKGCLVTIVEVETSKDLRHAKVLISVLPTTFIPKVLEALRKNIGSLQHDLNQRLTLKPLPRIKFFIDQTEKEAVAIDELLNRISKEIK